MAYESSEFMASLKNVNRSESGFMSDNTTVDREELATNFKYGKLMPVDADISPYKDALDFVFEDTEIRNIAITGSYGSGKSSLMRGIEKQYGIQAYKCFDEKQADAKNQKDEHRFLTISLTHFDTEKHPVVQKEGVRWQNVSQKNIEPHKEENAQDQSLPNLYKGKVRSETIKEDIEQTSESILSVLEGQIINQLIHRINNNYVPKSRFHKTKKSSLIFCCAVAFYLVFTLLYFLSLGNVLMPHQLFHVFDTRTIGTIVWAIFSIAMLTAILRRNAFNRTIKRIGLQGNEVELFDEESNSRFDRFMDDIVYLLHECKCDVVVFEDLDRFNEAEIFVRLREINDLVNAMREHEKDSFSCKLFTLLAKMAGEKSRISKYIKKYILIKTKPLRFFYLVRDDIFTSKDRTKFFDFMIPVIPYTDYSNSLRELENALQGEKCLPSKKCLKDIALFLDDARLLNNIVNEYHSYTIRLNLNKPDFGEERWSKLFGLIVYKNLFPIDFAKLQSDEGCLYNLLSNKERYEEKLRKHFDKKKEDALKGQKQALAEIEDKYLFHKLKSKAEIVYWCEANGLLERFNELATVDDLDELLAEPDTDSEFVDLIVQTSEEIRYETNYDQQVQDAKKPYLAQVAIVDDQLKRLDRATVGELLGMMQESLPEDFKKCFLCFDGDEAGEFGASNMRSNLAVRMLVFEGYIDEFYRKYISLFPEGGLSQNDHDYCMKVAARLAVNSDHEFDDSEAVLKEMPHSLFALPGSRTFSLVETLFSPSYSEEDSTLNRKRKVFLESLRSNKDKEFVVEYVCSQHYSSLLFEQAISYGVNLAQISLKEGLHIAEEKMREYATRAFLDLPDNTMLLGDGEGVSEYAFHDRNFLSLNCLNNDESEIERFCSALEKLDGSSPNRIRFACIDFKKAQPQILEYVYQNGLYEPNAEVIIGMLQTQHDLNDVKIESLIMSILSLGGSPVQTKIEKEIDFVLRELLSLGWCENAQEVTVWVFGETLLSSEAAALYISRLPENSIVKIEMYPSSYWSAFLERKLVVSSFSNAIAVYEKEGEISNLLSNLLNDVVPESIDSSSLDDIDEKVADQLMRDIVRAEAVSYNAIAIILQNTRYVFSDIGSTGFVSEKVSILVNEKALKFSVDNFLAISSDDFKTRLLFAVNNLVEYCSAVEGGLLAPTVAFLESLFETTEPSIEQCRMLISHLSEPMIAYPSFCDNANFCILEGEVSLNTGEYLYSIWENAGSQLREKIIESYFKIAQNGETLPAPLPFEVLQQVLSGNDLPLEYRKYTLASNIEYLEKNEVLFALQAVGLNHFRTVVEGTNTRKKTKTACSAANREIARKLKEHGLITSWWNDSKNSDHVWIQGAKAK